MAGRILKDSNKNKIMNVTIRDILLSDLTNNSESGYYCQKDSSNICKFDLFMDEYENSGIFIFNLSINGQISSNMCNGYFAMIVPGRENDKGNNATRIDLTILQQTPETVVSLSLPKIKKDRDLLFSHHKNGFSVAKYALYGSSIDANGSNILFAKGRIYKTDLVFDFVENNKG
jgi:hypothetical protein